MNDTRRFLQSRHAEDLSPEARELLEKKTEKKPSTQTSTAFGRGIVGWALIVIVTVMLLAANAT